MFERRDYSFDLPQAQIAQVPPDTRDGARLLELSSPLADRQVADLPSVLARIAPGSVVVVNDTRVIPARLHTHRPTGGAVELLFVEPESGTASPTAAAGEVWRCLARAKRPLRVGDPLLVGNYVLHVARSRTPGDRGDATIAVAVPGQALPLLTEHGELPLPPYIERTPDGADAERYQTIFARAPGAVAAPTAGLHLTPALVAQLRAGGHELATVTLHVGLGTFMPMRADDIRDHQMHRERFDIPPATATLIASGRPVVAVGTTVVRALEAASTGEHLVASGPGSTDLFLHPGGDRTFRVVDHLLTNFHLPESTLLMLVCAFAGTERTLAAYRHAVAAGYRFFSYGDAMFVSRERL